VRIGIDVQVFRFPAGGIVTYLSNVLSWLGRLEHPHRVTLFLYGQPLMNENPGLDCQLRTAFPKMPLRYSWDGVPPRLLSDCFGPAGACAPWWVRQIDRRVLFPLWQKLVRCESPLVGRLWHHRGSPWQTVDLFHHPAGLLFPLHRRANVVTVNDLIPRHFPDQYAKMLDWFEESYARAPEADMVLTYSEHTKREAVELLGVAEDRVRVIPLAAQEQFRPVGDQELLRATLAKYDLAGRPYVLYVGHLEPRRNLVRLVEAFGLLRREEPGLEHRLVLVGHKGDQGDRSEPVFDAIRDRGLGPHVRWLGYAPRADLPVLMSGADLFVYPSLYEGFGLPPLEAMACGTPVVVSATTSLPEVVGDAGLLVDPLQVGELAAAMHRVLTDRQLRAALRDKGLRRARLFSWDRTARLTLAAYEEAWERSRRKRCPRRRKRLLGKGRKEWRDWMIGELASEAINKTGP
jgi:glycosyltransferase involved in cell wall biosynthesis